MTTCSAIQYSGEHPSSTWLWRQQTRTGRCDVGKTKGMHFRACDGAAEEGHDM
jgi:hypothetical protein